MTNRAAATRYARALFDVALREADVQAIERQLSEFVALFETHPVLAKVLLNPAVPVHRKRCAAAALAERMDLAPVLFKLIGLLAGRDRLALLPDLLEAYRARLMDHLGVVRAEVTTAVPLPADRAAAIQHGLAKVTGRKVVQTVRVDPSIVGGVVARIGSVVYDGSVRTQLERMREALAEES